MAQFIQINPSQISQDPYAGMMINTDIVTGPAIIKPGDTTVLLIPIFQGRGNIYIEMQTVANTNLLISRFNELLFNANPSGNLLTIEVPEELYWEISRVS